MPLQYSGNALSGATTTKTFTPKASGLLFVEAHSRRNSSSGADNIITINSTGTTNQVTKTSVGYGSTDGFTSATLYASVMVDTPVTVTISASSTTNGSYILSVIPGMPDFI